MPNDASVQDETNERGARSKRDNDRTDQPCQRCGEAEAFAEFSHVAIEGEWTSSYDICKDCLRSLGEWFGDGRQTTEDER